MSEGRIIGFANDYAEFQTLMRARVDELNVSRDEINTAIGLTRGHASKLLAEIPIKAFGRTTLGPMMGALRVKIALIEAPERAAEWPLEEGSRDARKVTAKALLAPGMHHLANLPEVRALERKVLRKLLRKLSRKGASKGGIARAENLTASQRRHIARHAARMRWHPPLKLVPDPLAPQLGQPGLPDPAPVDTRVLGPMPAKLP